MNILCSGVLKDVTMQWQYSGESLARDKKVLKLKPIKTLLWLLSLRISRLLRCEQFNRMKLILHKFIEKIRFFLETCFSRFVTYFFFFNIQLFLTSAFYVSAFRTEPVKKVKRWKTDSKTENHTIDGQIDPLLASRSFWAQYFDIFWLLFVLFVFDQTLY